MVPNCKKEAELRRQWKRTARQWARPHPFWMCAGGLSCWAVTTLIIGLGLSAAYYFGKTERGAVYNHVPMLHALDRREPSTTILALAAELEQSSDTHNSMEPPAIESSVSAPVILNVDNVNVTETDGASSHIAPAETEAEASSAMTAAAASPINPFSQENEDFASAAAKPPRAWQDDAVVSMSNPPKACLALIMKNEGPILPRLFESVKGFASAYCVVDTGSTDDTIDVLRSIDMPGMLVEEPFVDFAVTRNFLLDTCRQRTTCEYLLLLDADMRLRVSPEWDWAKLDDKDVYDFVQVSGLEYANVRMIKRSADNIKVVGATHEYYDVPPEYSQKLLPKSLIHIDDVGDGKAKGDKFQRDERLLKRDLEKDPNNVRTVFYLANTLKDQGKSREAIPYYERRATMGGWYAEADYSWFQLSTCYLALHDFERGREYAEKAAYDGWYKRAEPLYFLAFYLHKRGDYEEAWYYATLASRIPKPQVSTVLFIAYTIYDYWIAYEQASLCRRVFPTERRYCLETAIAFHNNLHAPNDLIEYHYPDMKEIVQPILQEEDKQNLYTHELTVSFIKSLITLRHATNGDSPELLLPHLAKEQVEGRLSFQVLARAADESTLIKRETMHFKLADGHTLENLNFISPNTVVGHSADGATLFMGKWNMPQQHQAEQANALDLKAYTITSAFDASCPWALFEALDGSMYCITQYYPTIDIGYLKVNEDLQQARCDRFKSIHNVPRSFSFFRRTSGPALVRKGSEVWVLVHSRRADADMLSVIVLGLNLEIRGYTLPFILRPWNEKLVSSKVQMAFQGTGMGESVTFLFESEGEKGGRTVKVESVPLNRIRTLLVTTGL